MPQNPPRPHAEQENVDETSMYQEFPVLWFGRLNLKKSEAVVQMHYLAGNPLCAITALPTASVEDLSTLKITQKMPMELLRLENIKRQILVLEAHCTMIALPYGTFAADVVEQSNIVRKHIIGYLNGKDAAGIACMGLPESLEPISVTHIFPPSEFTVSYLRSVSPELLERIFDITYLLIVITKLDWEHNSFH